MRREWTLLLGLAAAACSSAGTDAPAPEPPAAEERSDPRNRVSIPADVAAQLDAWMADEATLIADVIEVDATRIPFAAHVAIEASRETDSAGKRLVERTETSDPATGAQVLTLKNRSGFTTTIETLPRMRLGGGRQFIATDTLVLRYVPSPGTDRPVTFSAVGKGRARLVGGTPPRRIVGDAITVAAEISRAAAGYAFRSTESK
jgi:hypothetical protein